MSGNISILDKVIDSHKSKEKEQFYPSDLVSTLLKHLSGKEEDILRRRFGLNRANTETLEQIGKSYNVTRERIRQIENNSVAKMKGVKNSGEIVGPVEHLVTSLIAENGNFMSEEMLLNNLVGFSDDKEMDSRAVVFILKVILKKKFQYQEDDFFRPTWGLKHGSEELLKKMINEFISIIESSKKPLPADQIVSQVKETEIYQANSQSLSDQALNSYLHLSVQIDKNPYGEFGLVGWGSINPKRINAKIYLVMQKDAKPLHFAKIAQKINSMKFDARKAYPPTIHNELIMNDQYVLVGRGVYALKEWGYKPGVVADVLVDILKKSDCPMTRKKLVEAVLDQRMVKKNTIHLALTNKSLFQKLEDGKYQLVPEK